MDNKPIITCHGEMDLFMKFHAIIVQNLPKEATGWKRSYGRPAQTIFVEASFVPYNPDILLSQDEWTLLGRPFFHTYWADCDIDTYKSSVKENIADWLSELKAHGISDWLIIFVVNDESKVKTKLLRTSVHDKIKSDFCSKQTERCALLSEPLKGEPSHSESWQQLLFRLRQLILVSYTDNVSRFENHMRSERERRTEDGWSFHKYFLLQEELAFMLEMLGLHEDTLVQYDELDALFTQFILNHIAGVNATWISWLMKGQRAVWDGLCLSPAINNDTRQLIRNHTVSLIQLRNYLFSRQAALLLRLHRPAEVAQRSIEFMHNTLQELNCLKIEMPGGALQCWIFLSCVEVLKTCERNSGRAGIEPYCLHTASLWDYARIKLGDIGQVCSLVRGSDPPTRSVPTGLIEGATAKRTFATTGELAGDETSEPLQQLKEALSSREAFRKHYLELSELAMGTYKHIGRMRSARKIGKDLADFYMQLGEPQLAEGFLTDAFKVYQRDKWSKLTAYALIDLAQCQKLIPTSQHKYLRSCERLATITLLPEETRLHYLQEFLEVTTKLTGRSLALQAPPALLISAVRPPDRPACPDLPTAVVVCVTSRLPAAVTCQRISVTLQQATHRVSVSSVSSVSSDTSDDATPTADLYAEVTRRADGRVTTSGVMCRGAARVRLDSDTRRDVERDAFKLETAHSLRADDVTLSPGQNTVTMTGELSEPGVYNAVQMCFSFGDVQLLASMKKHALCVEVSARLPTATLRSPTGPLWLGLAQRVDLVVDTGSYQLKGDCTLNVRAPELRLYDSDAMRDGCIVLPPTASEQKLTFPITVLAKLSDCSRREADFEVQLSCDQIEKCCQTLTFHHPFKFTHRLHSTDTKQFIQLTVLGVGRTRFLFTGQRLTTDCPDVELLPISSPTKPLAVNADSSASYVWQVCCGPTVTEEPSLHLNFTASYRVCSDIEEDEGKKREKEGDQVCSFSFTLNDYKVLYTIRSEVTPTSGDSLCKAGTACRLRLTICQLDSKTSACQTQFSVQSDSNWVVSDEQPRMCEFDENRFETCLDVQPRAGGCLPLPITSLTNITGSESELGSAVTCEQDDELTSVVPALTATQVYDYTAATQVHVLPAAV